MNDRLSSRAGFGPSVAPDGSAFAHIVEVDGYPRAVQHTVSRAGDSTVGLTVTGSRLVTLPVDGPVAAVRYSPDGHWLACQTAPEGGNRSQVWVVTNDPDDPSARRIDDPSAPSTDLVGWDGSLVALTVEHADGVGESRVVDPEHGASTVLDRRPGGRLLDAWNNTALVRVGPRGDRSLRLLRGGRELAIFADDPGATSDPGVILDDHRPVRRPAALGGGGDLLWPATAYPPEDDLGYLRLVVRTDYRANRPRLVLVTVTPDGHAVRVLAGRDEADLDEFALSADNTTAALLWNVGGGRSELQFLELTDGTLHDPVPLPGDVASEPSISADGSVLAVTVEGPGLPKTVELYHPHGSRWSAVDRVATDPEPVHPERVDLTARDGLPLMAWLYRAPGSGGSGSGGSGSGGSGAAGPGPTVIDLHGGPEGQARPAYHHLYPRLLAAGWTVIAPNVRGSAGFGRDFVHADDLDRRYHGITDVADVVGSLVSAGVADPAAVVCAGRSYGGYLTLAALTAFPDLFVGGISTCGMSDLLTFYATTEPWIGAAAVSKYGDPAADAALLADLSPLRRVAAVRVPVLFVHGSRDTNVPPSESTQMADAITARGGRAEVLIVADEGHELSQPANRELVADRVLAFLDSLRPRAGA